MLQARRTTAAYAAALFAILLGAYLLIYTGIPDSADGDALLAVSASLLRTGNPNIHAVAYADMLFPVDSARMGTFGADGALYSKKGITPSLGLLPFVLAADLLPFLSTRTAAMLFNPVVTAATALVLFAFLRRLNYARWVAFAAGLIYGLATLAFPYARTLYGEPLAALLLLIAVYGLYEYWQRGRWNWLTVLATAVSLLVGVNTIYVLPAGLLGLLAFIEAMRQRKWQHVLALTAPVFMLAAAFGLYNAVRFGSPFTTGYRFSDGEGFSFPFMTGVFGLTLSPYRGLFWYSPVLLLALPGWLTLRRQTSKLAWLILALVMLQLVMFASWWSWDGGVTWGPRFMLPAIPLMMLALAPLIVEAVKRWWLALILIGFVALSFYIQLLGALFDHLTFLSYQVNALWGGDITRWRTDFLDQLLTDPYQNAIIGHTALLLSGWPLLAGWVLEGASPLLWIAPVMLIAIGVLALVVRTIPAKIGGALIAMFSIGALLVVGGARSTAGGVQNIAAVSAALHPVGTVYAATTLFGDGLLDLEQRVPAVAVNAPTAPNDRDARPLWDWSLQQGDRLWLITWFAPANPENWQERELWEQQAFVLERPVPDHRALLFDTRPIDAEPQAGGWQFGDIALESMRIQPHSDGVSVELNWQLAGRAADPASWFVHLLDASGNIIAQQDRQPLGGYAPVQTWEQGQQVTDRLFLAANGENYAGWSLRIGWVNAQGERLPTLAPDGAEVPDGFILIPLENE